MISTVVSISNNHFQRLKLLTAILIKIIVATSYYISNT